MPCHQYVFVVQGDTDIANRNSLCRLDRCWSGRNGFGWNLYIQGTGHFLEDIFHLNLDRIDYRIEVCFFSLNNKCLLLNSIFK